MDNFEKASDLWCKENKETLWAHIRHLEAGYRRLNQHIREVTIKGKRVKMMADEKQAFFNTVVTQVVGPNPDAKRQALFKEEIDRWSLKTNIWQIRLEGNQRSRLVAFVNSWCPICQMGAHTWALMMRRTTVSRFKFQCTLLCIINNKKKKNVFN